VTRAFTESAVEQAALGWLEDVGSDGPAPARRRGAPADLPRRVRHEVPRRAAAAAGQHARWLAPDVLAGPWWRMMCTSPRQASCRNAGEPNDAVGAVAPYAAQARLIQALLDDRLGAHAAGASRPGPSLPRQREGLDGARPHRRINFATQQNDVPVVKALQSTSDGCVGLPRKEK
jgi:hypothetical protein